jgi:hypothetical protein
MISPQSSATPIKQLTTGDLLLGSDDRFSLVLKGLTSAERSFVQFLLGAGAMPKDFKDVSDERRAEITEMIKNRFMNYPFSTRGIERLSHACIALYGSGEAVKECAHLLARSGVGIVYIAEKALSMQISQELQRSSKKLATKTRITNATQSRIDVAICVSDHTYEMNSANDLMMNHTPYLPLLLQGTRAQLGPLNISGMTPCMNCLARTFNENDGLEYKFGTNRHLPTLVTMTAGMAVSKVLSFINDRITDEKMCIVEEPGARVKYAEVNQSEECGCTHFAKYFTAQYFDSRDLITAL